MAHVASLREAFDDLVAVDQNHGLSPATISFHSRNWKRFVRDTGVETVADLSPAVVRAPVGRRHVFS